MTDTLPPYARYTVKLLGLTLLIIALKRLDDVLLPILFSALFAFLLVPVTRRLENWRFPRWLAILISILLMAGVLTAVIWILTNQLMSFANDWDHIQGQMVTQYEHARVWIYHKFGYTPPNKDALLKQSLQSLRERGSGWLGSAANTTSGVVEVLTLVPVYVYCFLYFRDHFRQFIYRFVNADNRSVVMHVISKIEDVTQSYLVGVLTVILIVALLNTTGLLLLGVKYALFFGAFASVMAIIPFIGMMLGASLAAVYTLVETGSPLRALGVVGVFTVVQFLEGNFITPSITGSKVSVNALAAIVGLILGGELWGLPGMILSIPLVAVLKVVFDATPNMEPYGFLLGDVNDGVVHKSTAAAGSDSLWTKLKRALRKPKF